MCIAIRNVGQAAGILAGAVLVLPDGLFKVRATGLVLGVHGHIIVPAFAVDGGHRQRDKERIASAGDILQYTGLHHQIEPLLQSADLAVSVFIRLGHGLAAISGSSFQRIFDGGGVGGQCIAHGLVQLVGGIVAGAVFALVCICGGQADGLEHGILGKAVQHTYLTLPVHQFIVHGDVSYPQIGELHALNSVLRQLVGNGIVLHTGADIGRRIPRPVLAGRRDVVLIKGKGRFPSGVNGRRCKRRADKPQGHDHSQEQRPKSFCFLHRSVLLFHRGFFAKINTHAEHECRKQNINC